MAATSGRRAGQPWAGHRSIDRQRSTARRGDPAEVLAHLAAVPAPNTDLVWGTGGPLLRAWSGDLAPTAP